MEHLLCPLKETPSLARFLWVCSILYRDFKSWDDLHRDRAMGHCLWMDWMDDGTNGWMKKASRKTTMTSFTICNNPKFSFVSILQPEVHLLWATPNLRRKLLMGKSIWLLLKERKSCELTHDLINMDHTIPIRDKTPNCMMSLALA